MKVRSAAPADCPAIAELALAVDCELISIKVSGSTRGLGGYTNVTASE